MIVHIVMFKFKDENKEANLEKATKMLNSLVGVVPSLKSMEVGINFDTADRAFDLSLYSTFDTKDGLDAYAIDPAHLEVVKFIKEVALESKVVDYIKS